MAMCILSGDIFLYLLEYHLFIPLEPGSMGPHHVLAGHTTQSLDALSLTCRRLAILARQVKFRDLRLTRHLTLRDLEILQSIGPHVNFHWCGRRLALVVKSTQHNLAIIIAPLTRLQSLHLTHDFKWPSRRALSYPALSTYPQLAHLSVDIGASLPVLLEAFPALQTLQLSPFQCIPPACPVHTALRRLKLLSIPPSFGHGEMLAVAKLFPDLKELELRFEKTSYHQLRLKWEHVALRRWLGPVSVLPLKHLTLGYFSFAPYEDNFADTSRMLAQHYLGLEHITWRHNHLIKYTACRRIADLLVAENTYNWELSVTVFEVRRGRDVEVQVVNEG